MITVGGCGWYWILRCSPPSSATSSSLTIFTICWPGVSDSSTSLPIARSRMRSTKARATRKLTSASSRATRTSRKPDLDVLLGETAAAGEAAQRRGEPIAECFEHRQALTGAVARRARSPASMRSRRSSSAAWPSRVLEVLELRQRAAHQVVGAAAGAREVLGELGERPVLVEVQAAGLALVLGEHGAVDVEEPLLPRRARRAVGGRRIDLSRARP